MKYNLLCVFSLITFITSCGQTNTLTPDDYKWMPYHGNETLVFKSSAGELDTIFFIRRDTLWGYPDPALSTSKYEIAAIFCKHTDPYTQNGKHRYLQNYFLKLKKTMSKHTELFFDLSAKNANFYRLNGIKIDSLTKEPPKNLQIKIGNFDDVYVIDGEDYLGSFHERSDFITKLYWSKSHGLIRYDKKDGIYWELSQKW